MDSDLTEAVAALAEARDRLAEAKSEHVAQRDRVHALLDRMAADATGGIDGEVARRLYWHAPEVHVERIGRACGLERNRVHEFAGASVDLGFHCPRCDADYTITLHSRTAVARVMTSKHPRRFCEPCHAEWLDEVRRHSEGVIASMAEGVE